MEKLEKISEKAHLSDNLKEIRSIAFKKYIEEPRIGGYNSKSTRKVVDYECTMSTCHCATD